MDRSSPHKFFDAIDPKRIFNNLFKVGDYRFKLVERMNIFFDVIDCYGLVEICSQSDSLTSSYSQMDGLQALYNGLILSPSRSTKDYNFIFVIYSFFQRFNCYPLFLHKYNEYRTIDLEDCSDVLNEDFLKFLSTLIDNQQKKNLANARLQIFDDGDFSGNNPSEIMVKIETYRTEKINTRLHTDISTFLLTLKNLRDDCPPSEICVPIPIGLVDLLIQLPGFNDYLNKYS